MTVYCRVVLQSVSVAVPSSSPRLLCSSWQSVVYQSASVAVRFGN